MLLISTDVAVVTVMSGRKNRATHSHGSSHCVLARERRRCSEYLGRLIDGRIMMIGVYMTLGTRSALMTAPRRLSI
jgi:hypothetical protein